MVKICNYALNFQNTSLMRIFSLVLLMVGYMLTQNPVSAQVTIRVMHYNLMQYGVSPPDCTPPALASRDVYLDSITRAIKPDIFTVNEMANDPVYASRIRTKSLKYATMQNAGYTNTKNSSIVNMLFYNPQKLGYKSVEVINGLVRDINVYTLYEKTTAANNDTTFLYCIVAHLKAGNTSSDANERASAATNVMNWLAAKGAGKNVIYMGDCNLYSTSEAAYQTFIFNADTANRLYDPTGATTNGWSSSHKQWLTQCPRTSGGACFSGGGLDSRFDFMLFNKPVMTGINGVSYNPNSFKVIGNDGTIYNADINCTNNKQVSKGVCQALYNMSDHLPIYGEVTFTKATAMEHNATLAAAVEIAGNPVADVLQGIIRCEEPQPLRLSLWDMHGRKIADQSLPTAVENEFSVDMTALSTGIYFLKIENAQGKHLIEKVMKL